MKKYVKIINIVLLLICIISIFLLSNENKSKSVQTSTETTKKIVNVVSNDNNKASTIAKDHYKDARKIAHVIEYFCLGVLFINVLKDYRRVNYKWLIVCILFCMLYSVSDEIHQLYVLGRNCRFVDVIIDTLGSSIGIVAYYLIYKYIYTKPVKSIEIM